MTPQLWSPRRPPNPGTVTSGATGDASKPAASGGHGRGLGERDSGGFLIVPALTEGLVQFCHLWMVPAGGLRLVAGDRKTKGGEKKQKWERRQGETGQRK